MNPVEITLQPAESADIFDASTCRALHALMKLYESGQILDEEESEVELMIQLSGMVMAYNDSAKREFGCASGNPHMSSDSCEAGPH